MSRLRFEQISRYLHVSDELNYPNDKFAKLRPIIDKLISNFQSYYYPSREITVDRHHMWHWIYSVYAGKAHTLWLEELGPV